MYSYSYSHEADRCYKKGGGWWKKSHQYLAEQAAAGKGAGRKGADKNNRSNVKGIAKEVIALLRGGGDTSDDSDPYGADAVPDEAGGVTAPEGSVVGDAIGDSVSEPDSEVSMPRTAPTLPWNAWDEPEWEPAIE